MFFNKGEDVISCASAGGEYILEFGSFNVCANTMVHDIIKEEKDASKEE